MEIFSILSQLLHNPEKVTRCLQKYVMKYASNRTCSQPRQTNCTELPPTHRTGRGSTSRQTECGVGDLRRHFLMYESSTPTPPPTGIRHLPPATENTRGKRNEHTHRGYSNWSIRLSLHLFFRSQEEWGERQPVSTNVWLQCSLRSGITHTAPHSACMAEVPIDLLPYSLSHTIPARSKIFSTSRRPPPSSNRPRQY